MKRFQAFFVRHLTNIIGLSILVMLADILFLLLHRLIGIGKEAALYLTGFALAALLTVMFQYALRQGRH